MPVAHYPNFRIEGWNDANQHRFTNNLIKFSKEKAKVWKHPNCRFPAKVLPFYFWACIGSIKRVNQGSFLSYLEYVDCTILVIFMLTIKLELPGFEKFGGSWHINVPSPLQMSARAVSTICTRIESQEKYIYFFFIFQPTHLCLIYTEIGTASFSTRALGCF